MTFDEIRATLPWGLHDAYLEALVLDWLGARLELTVRLMMSESQDMDQRGRITVRGLKYCAIEPPSDDEDWADDAIPENGLWIDSGAGAAPKAEPTPAAAPPGCFLQWIYVHDWNRFIHVCGTDVTFAWLEAAPLPARGRTRAYFEGDEIPDPLASP